MTDHLDIEYVPVADLEEWPGNARVGNVERIKASMRQHGVFNPVIVQRSTNRVMIGNHRIAALRELHDEDPKEWDGLAPVIYYDVDDTQANKINLIDNKASDEATWDTRLPVEQLQEILEQEESLFGTGFSEDELDDLAARLTMADVIEDNSTEADEQEIDPPRQPISRLGDIWELGHHKVICGDSTLDTTYQRLMGNTMADLIWTDPPYGVSYVGRTEEKLTIQNDGAEGLPALLDGAFARIAAHARPGAPIYVAHADTERITFETSMRKAGLIVRQNLVWVKNSLVLGRSDYHYQHEPILYGTAPEDDYQVNHEPILYGFTANGEGRLGRGGQRWYGDDAQTTVFKHDRPGRSKDHPTMKPVALIRDMLSNSLRPGGVVLDPFAGSGSTLLAAHYEGATARVVELDPGYVDVICRRYQELTGGKPMRNGKTYDFLADDQN